MCERVTLNFFCFALETVSDNANGYTLDPSSAFSFYPPTNGVYKTAEAMTAFPSHLHYVDVYM